MTPGDETSNGWAESAEAWIADMGEHGDFGRRYVLDPVMRERLGRRPYARMLDVGCGEGRFCRMAAAAGLRTLGVDPTSALIDRARSLHLDGDYRLAVAEALPVDDASFDLVVSCLSLIDIPDFRAAIAEMSRVLQPGGSLLIANLTHFPQRAATAFAPGRSYFEEGAAWEAWRGIRVRNWRRPLSAYMQAFLGEGLRLEFFDEPAPVGGDPGKVKRFNQAPWYVVMEWAKPD